jgi:hypothetical protein
MRIDGQPLSVHPRSRPAREGERAVAARLARNRSERRWPVRCDHFLYRCRSAEHEHQQPIHRYDCADLFDPDRSKRPGLRYVSSGNRRSKGHFGPYPWKFCRTAPQPDVFTQMPLTPTMKIGRLRYMTDPLPADILAAEPISPINLLLPIIPIWSNRSGRQHAECKPSASGWYHENARRR